jgi:hypothetical protein
MQLFRVYARLVKPNNAEVASAAFHSVINFNVHLGMTNAAAHMALAGDPVFGTRFTIGQADKRSGEMNWPILPLSTA